VCANTPVHCRELCMFFMNTKNQKYHIDVGDGAMQSQPDLQVIYRFQGEDQASVRRSTM
jgi:hypothetical protein